MRTVHPIAGPRLPVGKSSVKRYADGVWRLIASIALAGCSAQLGHGNGAASDAPTASAHDAPVAVDAPPDAKPDAPPDAYITPRVVYFDFGGVTLTKTATSNSTTNDAAWIGVATATIAAYAGSADPDTVTSEVKILLADVPVSIVTTRPTSGEYILIAFGGSDGDVGSTYTWATGDHDCGDLDKDGVAWVSDVTPTVDVVPTVVGAIGWNLGLQGTTDTTDCMCGWATDCTLAGSSCTLSTSIATGSSAAPSTTCPNENPQNELGSFQTAFGG
jgi:hypothetical protein